MAEMDAQERLERRLAELAGAIEWPVAPNVRLGVRAGVVHARRRRVRLILLAAALGLVVVGGTAAATFFELHGATIQRVPHLPAVPSPSGVPGSAGVRLGLGDRYPTLAAAERAAGFRALVPATLGQPDEVYWRPSPGQGELGVLTLLYSPRPGLPATSDPGVGALVMEARASAGANAFVKVAGPGTSVTPVTVNAGAGYWVSGAPHGVVIVEGNGIDRVRLAGNVLIWNQAGMVLRIESGLDEQQALRVARSAA